MSGSGSGPDRWTVRVYELFCRGCGQISRKSFVELEMNDRLPCDQCGVSINVADYYGQAELDVIAKSLGSSGHILRQRKKRD